ncbi:MAG: hypothetical protein ACK4KT_01105 [Thermaurantimonas sp.]
MKQNMCLFVAFISCTALTAQYPVKDLYIGLKGGLTYNYVNENVSSIAFAQTNGDIGLLLPSLQLLYRITPTMYFESGLEFVDMSRSIIRTGLFGGLFHTITRRYLSVPVGIRLTTPGRFCLFVNHSFRVGYWLSARDSGEFINLSGIDENSFTIKIDNQKYEFDTSYETDRKKDNRFHSSACIGTGFMYDMRRWGLVQLGVDFYQGLTDLYRYEQKPEDMNSRYNSGAMIYLAYSYPIIKNR